MTWLEKTKNEGTFLIDSYSETNASAQVNLYATATILYAGQTFYNKQKCIVTSLKLYGRRNGSPTGGVRVFINELTGTPGVNALPKTGPALNESEYIDITTIDTTNGLIEFNFLNDQQITLEENTYYGFSIYSTATDSSNYLVVRYDVTSPTHSGNAFKSSNGETYSVLTPADFCFYVYGKYIWDEKIKNNTSWTEKTKN